MYVILLCKKAREVVAGVCWDVVPEGTDLTRRQCNAKEIQPDAASNADPAVAKTGVKMTLDECQSVFTLIRTDTTHDLSQKAEKVCLEESVTRRFYT